MHVIWPPVIFGAVFIVFGIISIVFRAKWADYATQIAHDTWGAWKGTRKPWMLVLGGVIAIAFGISAALGGLDLL